MQGPLYGLGAIGIDQKRQALERHAPLSRAPHAQRIKQGQHFVQLGVLGCGKRHAGVQWR